MIIGTSRVLSPPTNGDPDVLYKKSVELYTSLSSMLAFQMDEMAEQKNSNLVAATIQSAFIRHNTKIEMNFAVLCFVFLVHGSLAYLPSSLKKREASSYAFRLFNPPWRHVLFLQNVPLKRSLFMLGSSVEEWEDSVFLDEEDDDSSEFFDGEASQIKEEHTMWIKATNKALEALEKKQKSLQSELEKAEKIQSYRWRANLMSTYLYMFTPGVTTITVQDWEQDGKEVELSLDSSYSSAAEEVDDLYQQVRKLKRGSHVVGELLGQTVAALQRLLELKEDLDASLTDEGVNENLFHLVQDRLIRSSHITQFSPPSAHDSKSSNQKARKNFPSKQKKADLGSPASNVRKLRTKAGCTILVGRNRRGNEHLSCTVAKGNDVWMHARGAPGAHVLILQRRGDPVATPECWQLAADLAAFYSDARTERKADVTVAEPKHVQKPRGAPLGAVKLREEAQVLTGYPENVPEDLKEQRIQSGLSDEYRASDKAKL
jgi:predicted ribosome quality control (RQC) complex YloA/Tae2 family protein